MIGSGSSAPVCNTDFYSAETIADPAALYQKLHDLGPVVYLSHHSIHGICGHQTLTENLRNHAVFRSGHGVSINEDVNKLLVGSTLNSDPPEHDHTRSITFSPLTPKALANVRQRIEQEAELITDELVARGSFDAAAELAPHVPLSIVRDLVGLGEHGKENMLTWATATFELMGNPGDRRDKAVSDLKQLRQFLEDPSTLDNLTQDGWARKAMLRGMEEGIEPGRSAELMRDYIAPSLDTTISAIGYAIMLFAKHPEQWELLRRDPSLVKNAIEEIVRLNTPIRAFTRKLATNAEVVGIHLKQGERVLMMYGAANRDPQKFPDPHRFDVTRNTRGHVGFGHGVHACLGMHLARLEMTCLFETLLRKVKRFSLDGPIKTAINSTIHAYASVPVTVERI